MIQSPTPVQHTQLNASQLKNSAQISYTTANPLAVFCEKTKPSPQTGNKRNKTDPPLFTLWFMLRYNLFQF